MKGIAQSQLERQGMGPYDMLLRRHLETSFSWIHFCAADLIPELKRTKLTGLLVLSHMWVIQVISRYQSQELWHNEEGKKHHCRQRGKKKDEYQVRVNSSRQ